MRVAIDCRTATARMSGVGRYVINLVESLCKAPDLDLLLLVGNSVHSRLRRLEVCQLVGLGDTPTTQEKRLRWEQFSLPKLLKGLAVDLYHATWNYGVPGVSGVPAVLTVHDLYPLYTRAEFGSRRARLAFVVSQHLALFRSRRIIAVSSATRDEIARYAPWAAHRVSTIPEAVDPMFTPHADTDLDRRYLLYVGGFAPRKNIAVLLRAFEIAVTKHQVSLPLCMSGTFSALGADARQVWAAMPRMVQELVEFHVYEDEELPSMYRHAAAFVFPSKFEGFGLPPLEAMACGTPVITTRCGALPETVGGAASFVDAEDPVQLAAAMSRIITDRVYAGELVQRGLAHTSTMDWRQIASRTRDTYLQAAGRT
jgi:glycosyltransferase involved in cell wall biosynthesis